MAIEDAGLAQVLPQLAVALVICLALVPAVVYVSRRMTQQVIAAD